MPVQLQAHLEGEVAAQPHAGPPPAGIVDVEVVDGDLVPARVRWCSAVCTGRRPVLGSPLAWRDLPGRQLKLQTPSMVRMIATTFPARVPAARCTLSRFNLLHWSGVRDELASLCDLCAFA